MTLPRVNAYLTTDYQYHWLCCACGAVRHRAAGIDPGECECGSSSWKQRQVSPTGKAWYEQRKGIDRLFVSKLTGVIDTVEYKDELERIAVQVW